MEKILISDEVVEKTITIDQFQTSNNTAGIRYPYVLLGGVKFYYNRFVFL